MTKKQATDHFGTQEKLAHALDIAQSTVASWGEYPPPLRQIQIERLTHGELQAEPECFGAAA